MEGDRRRTPGQGRGAVRPRGDSRWMPPGTLQGCGSLERGRPWAGVRRRTRKTPAIRGASGREESRAETGSWRGIPGNGGRDGVARCPPHPPPPRDPRPHSLPARVTLAVWPRRCPRGAGLEPPAPAGLPPTLLSPRLGARDPDASCCWLFPQGPSGAGQRLAEGE